MSTLLLKEVRLNGTEVQVLDLFRYRHFWFDAERVAIETQAGWDVFEVVKWEEADIPTLLVRHIGRLNSLPVEVLA